MPVLHLYRSYVNMQRQTQKEKSYKMLLWHKSMIILHKLYNQEMFSMFGLLQKSSFSSFASLADLEVAQWGIAEKAPATHFPNSPWNWAPGILSFLPARLFPPLPWWSLIWGRWQLGCRPTPQEQGEGAEPSGQSLRQQGGNWFYHWPCHCLELASPWKGKV